MRLAYLVIENFHISLQLSNIAWFESPFLQLDNNHIVKFTI